MRTLRDESVHCCITSPPYWGLRDYGVSVQVWGGDREAVAVAEDLLAHRATVTIVVAGERFSHDAGRLAKALVFQRLRDSQAATTLFSSKVASINSDGVHVATPVSMVSACALVFHVLVKP